ncbi:unnamed protein product [Sphenostylis stenocarpa]|uniref:Uncharacterized protein n=1 Tax=Sphenostylis stenocarpa TaxID=92480 RepID=A0AA86SND6_9FABA|nr:unnamed protein product [Sphenostylis stenocarpa]
MHLALDLIALLIHIFLGTEELHQLPVANKYERYKIPYSLQADLLTTAWTMVYLSDEQYFLFGKMHGFSTVDGFVEISNCLAEMIKYVANEPSAGLFFIQQHTQNAVPNVMKLKNNVIHKSRETTLHTEDLEDSLTMVRSMKECGFPIAHEMIGDIKKSLVTMTSKQSTSNFQNRANSAVYAQEGSEIRGNYFSSVFNFSIHKTKSLNSPPLDSMGLVNSSTEELHLYRSVSLPDASTQADKKPLSSQVEDESQPEPSNIGDNLLSLSEKYDDFKASKEAKLEEWLEGTSNNGDNCLPGDEKRL